YLFANEHIYILKKGETLYRISKKFNVPVHILQTYNRIEDPSHLRPGTRIKIPSLHTVKKGDTLYSIAREYGIDLETFMKANNISDSTRLSIGKKLYIPYSGSSMTGTKSSSDPNSSQSLTATGTSTDSAFSARNKKFDVPVSDAALKTLLWPHPGPRESLKGKISGIVIRGETGDRVVSVSSGRVVWVGPYRGFSRVVFIESENRYIYVYAGNEKTTVEVGDQVVIGAEIGRLGKDVHEGIPQLYFLVYYNGRVSLS
ncbi:unnamed protein product, partial [marine sediment metagenome]